MRLIVAGLAGFGLMTLPALAQTPNSNNGLAL
jgi:hypothetical protein